MSFAATRNVAEVKTLELMPSLSKSKLIAYRQCPKRLWLEIHRPELRHDSARTQASFQIGHQVGDLARHLYDPKDRGTTLDIQQLGVGRLIEATRELMQQRRPIFEAGFSIGTRARGALAIADVLIPHNDGRSWEMTEVKSSTGVKDYHHDDVAIQYYIATQGGAEIKSLKLAHIDSGWTYPGADDYSRLLVEEDLTETAACREAEVRRWIADGHRIVASKDAPEQPIGDQCGKPFECGFFNACHAEDDRLHGVVEHPVHWLPGQKSTAFSDLMSSEFAPRSMLEVPDEMLHARQLRVKQQHGAGVRFFDPNGSAQALNPHGLPALFLDFETIDFAVPMWKGTRPYQAIPFQYSLHRLSRTGKLTHSGFLDLSSNDPSLRIAKALIASCGTTEPIYAYSKGFEGARLESLAQRFPALANALRAIRNRLVDLRPIAENYYYHPDQQGSWSIKTVLPTIAPELSYEHLGDVQDGGGAMEAYGEAVASGTSPERRQQIREQLWRYCRLDTFAMVRLWAFFSGHEGFAPAQDECKSVEVDA